MSSHTPIRSPFTMPTADQLAALDHAHVWHPFTPMQQWREQAPLVIERGEGALLYDTQGKAYIDGVSSLWCNVHGHRVAQIDRAIRDQLDKIAHTTLLGLASPPSIALAARLVAMAGDELGARAAASGTSPGNRTNLNSKQVANHQSHALNKVFYSDAGATALEVAFKMAVGYWYHVGQPKKKKFIGISGAYHGDTVGSMSIGYSELFHRPFASMVFECLWAAAPDACRPPQSFSIARPHDPAVFPSEDAAYHQALGEHCLADLESLLMQHADTIAGIVVEPVMQGAAGMICQPLGYVRGVAELARKYDTLLIADEVAVGFGRTGRLLACAHDAVTPDILCLAKGITGGYLPLAATMTTNRIEQAFCGELHEKKTLYHGHTYTGNPLACAAALASLDLFEDRSVYPQGLITHIHESADIIRQRLHVLHDHPNVLDIRQRGIMVGIELCKNRTCAESFDFSKRTGAQLCMNMRDKGLLIRPLGDILILMPICGMPHGQLHRMLDIVVDELDGYKHRGGL